MPFAKEEEKAEALRKDILGWYLRKADSDPRDPVIVAQSVYDQSAPDDRKTVRRLMSRLVQTGVGSTPAPATVVINDLEPELLPMARHFTDLGVIQFSEDCFYFGDRRVVDRWDLLRQWVNEDEQFLILRQQLTVGARSWQQSGRDTSVLLRGKLLKDALEWLGKRPDDFNKMEREFVEASEVESKLQTGKEDKKALLFGWKFRVLAVLSILLSLLFFATPLFDGIFPGKRYWSSAGEYWTAQQSGTFMELTQISGTSDGKRLWASGERGTGFVSTDGEHWAVQPSTLNADYKQYIFVTNQGKRLWALGDGGRIMASIDGMFLGPAGQRDYGQAMHSLLEIGDGKHLWVVGGGGWSLTSNDSEHWVAKASGTTADLYSIFATSDGTGLWAVGASGTILSSFDEGEH